MLFWIHFVIGACKKHDFENIFIDSGPELEESMRRFLFRLRGAWGLSFKLELIVPPT